MTATTIRPRIGARPGVQLGVATWASLVNFWAWNLIGPLAMTNAERMSLTSTQVALLVATPILAASVGRLIAGPLTDRFGGRTVLTVITLAAIIPVLAVGLSAAAGCYPLILISGFFLGIPGAVFAVGIPFVSNWSDSAHRGLSTGVFGMCMIGTALSAYFTPRFVRWFGLLNTHLIIAAALAATAVLAVCILRNGPAFTPNSTPVLPRLRAAARMRVTWEMSLLYAVVFGGFVAFSNYLPTYVKNVYGFSPIEAGSRTAAFALMAVLARPIGGVLADRIAPKYVVLAALTGITAFASIAVLQPPRDLWSATTFIALAFWLGIGTGGVFAWVTRSTPAGSLGSVTGIVSAAGGLGGYFPPIVMGTTYDPVHHAYTAGLLLLVITVLFAGLYTAVLLVDDKPTASRGFTAKSYAGTTGAC